MVVQKAAQRVKESSVAERVIGVLLGLIFASTVSFGSYLVSQFHEMETNVATNFAKYGERIDNHLENHPDVRINQSLSDHEQRIRDLERIYPPPR